MSYIEQIEKLLNGEYDNAKDGAFIALARGRGEKVDSDWLVMGNASTIFTSVCNQIADCIVMLADGDLEKMRVELRTFRAELGKMCYEKWEKDQQKTDITFEIEELTAEQKKAILGKD